MRVKAGIILSILYFTAVVLSCSSLGRQEEDQKTDRIERSEKSSAVQLPDGWKLEIEITHEGSRSEGSVSRLFYRYTEIPPVFERINIEGHRFEYRPMINIWDNSGYIYSGEAGTPEPSSDDLVNSRELKRGWYESGSETVKKATPPEWIRAEAGDVGVWISPDRISEMIVMYRLNSIERSGMLMPTPEPVGE